MSKALVPTLLLGPSTKIWRNVQIVSVGAISLALLAQISIPLGFTPVPITGQTFGVALISLLFGRNLGVSSVALYLLAGALGAPVFAGGTSATGLLTLGATSGYLLGMLFASVAMGSLSDLGGTSTVFRTWISAVIGSAITFTCGLIVLSHFVPTSALLSAGLIPFLPGDFIKTILVVAIITGAKRLSQRSTAPQKPNT